MGGKYSRDKGKRGEREVIELLQPVVNQVREVLELPPMQLKRNTLQSDRGGNDIAGLPWLAIEVKFHAKLALNAWWAQTIEQAAREYDGRVAQVPVLFYRTTGRTAWRVRMWGALHGEGRTVATLVDVASDDFLRWFRIQLAARLV
jgi:hypothetical protein